jgi:hypothetical protein
VFRDLKKVEKHWFRTSEINHLARKSLKQRHIYDLSKQSTETKKTVICFDDSFFHTYLQIIGKVKKVQNVAASQNVFRDVYREMMLKLKRFCILTLSIITDNSLKRNN